jgi:hypothetical protein
VSAYRLRYWFKTKADERGKAKLIANGQFHRDQDEGVLALVQSLMAHVHRIEERIIVLEVGRHD